MVNAIKRLTLTNFQSHSDTEIQPAPPGGLTVIVGPSGHGKTAILRALRWLLYNQPQGMAFMRKGAAMVRVTAELTNGVVTRQRTAGTNQYITVTEDAGRQVFEGFGTDVPLEIQQLTGVKPVKVADLTLQPNLARQLDGPFLGEEATSAGTRAKVLGRIAGIDEVDLATKSLATDQFRRGQEEKRLEREVADLTAREASYAHLPALHQRIEQLEALTLRLTQMDNRLSELERLLIRQRDIAKARRGAQEAVDRWAQVLPGLEAAIIRVEAAAARESTLFWLENRLGVVRAGLMATRANLVRWKGADEALDWTIDCFEWHDRNLRIAARGAALRDVRAGIGAATATLTRTAGAEAALTILEATATASARRDQLAAALGRLRQISNSSATLQGALRRLANAGRATEILAGAINVADRLGNLYRLRTSFERAHGSIAYTAGVVQRVHAEAAEAEQVYIDTLTAAGRCPVCGSEIHPEHIKEAV